MDNKTSAVINTTKRQGTTEQQNSWKRSIKTM